MLDFETLGIKTLEIVRQSNHSPASLRRILVESNISIADVADVLLNQVRDDKIVAQPYFKLAFVSGHNLGLDNYRYERVCKQGIDMWGFTLASRAHLIQILPNVKNIPVCRLVMEPIVHSKLGAERVFTVCAYEGAKWLSEIQTSIPSTPEELWAFVIPE